MDDPSQFSLAVALGANRHVVGLNGLRGLYVHIPFCPQICPYCAFASLRGVDHLHERYVEALCKELQSLRALRPPEPLQTVFFGGGTPTQIDPALIGKVLETADEVFGTASDVEITVEANPGTVDRQKFAHLRSLGCNRLSLGVQSFDDIALKKLGRVHSSEEAERAFVAAREAGFSNVSIDLIFSVPALADSVWKGSIEKAISLQPDHISAYALTIEEGTLFAKRERDGKWVGLTEDDDAMQYDWTRRRLLDAEFEQYEVSNFARSGLRSRHNWGYWTGVEYLGIGLSAHSFVGGERFWNVKDIETYLEKVEGETSPVLGRETVSEQTAFRERFWLGLRTAEGVNLSEKEWVILGADRRFAQFVDAEFISVDRGLITLADKGWNLADVLAIEITDILENATEGTVQFV